MTHEEFLNDLADIIVKKAIEKAGRTYLYRNGQLPVEVKTRSFWMDPTGNTNKIRVLLKKCLLQALDEYKEGLVSLSEDKKNIFVHNLSSNIVAVEKFFSVDPGEEFIESMSHNKETGMIKVLSNQITVEAIRSVIQQTVTKKDTGLEINPPLELPKQKTIDLPEEYCQLRDAIKENDKFALERALLKPVDINKAVFYIKEFDSSFTPLQLACYFGHASLVEILLSRDCSIDAISIEKEGLLQTVGQILSLGFWSRQGGFTALHLASKRGHEKCIKTLLSMGADYTITDNNKNLPLSISQLCYNFSVSDKLSDLTLSIYGALGDRDVKLIDYAFKNGKIKKVNLIFLPIDLAMEGGPFEVFSKVLDVLKRSNLLEKVTLQTQYQINTYVSDGMCHFTNEKLINIRKRMVQIQNILVDLAKNNRLVEIDFGVIEHVHTMSYMSSSEEYSAAKGGYVTVYKRKETVSTTRLFRIDNKQVDFACSNLQGARNQLESFNESIMQDGDFWVRLLSSEEGRMKKKVLDSEIILGFFSELKKALDKRATAIQAQEESSVSRVVCK